MWPFDDALTAINGLFALLIAIATALLYPLVVILSVIQAIWAAFYSCFADFVNAMILIPNTIIDVINAFFVGVFSTTIIGLMAINLGIVLALRLYSFMKDVSIFGCKL